MSSPPRAGCARIAELNVYPVKSAHGIALEEALLTPTGLAWDRHWMIVGANGRFVTQRELPRLALLVPSLSDLELQLRAPGMPELTVPLTHRGDLRRVRVWEHDCEAFDAGAAAREWLRAFLGRDCALVRFNAAQRRLSSRDCTAEHEAEVQFADGFPLLAISAASLADLNRRLSRPLPMNRFRPNIVLDGIGAYEEDHIEELGDDAMRLKPVKACTRCRITTTDQQSGLAEGDEPLRTLREYRYEPALRGVCFGQNLIILKGAGTRLRRGQSLQLRWKA